VKVAVADEKSKISRLPGWVHRPMHDFQAAQQTSAGAARSMVTVSLFYPDD